MSSRSNSGKNPGSRSKKNGNTSRRKSAGNSRSSGSLRNAVASKAAESAEKKSGGIDRGVRDEIIAIILIALGIFLIIAFQTTAAGSAGLALSHFFKGLFGFMAYILPYYFIVYGVLLFMRKTISVGVKSAVLLLIIFLMFSLINAGRFIDETVVTEAFPGIMTYYHNGMVLDDGGVFGMAVGRLIAKLIGLPGLYIFSILVIAISMLLLMNTPISRFFEKAKERREKSAEAKEAREQEKEQAKRKLEIAEDDRTSSSYGQETRGSSAGVTDRQRKILGYMKDDELASGKGNETLDFSLGENKEEKAERRSSRRKKNAAAADVSTAVNSSEGTRFKDDTAEDKSGAGSFGGPVIVGGLAPKTSEEKLTNGEAAKSTLKDDDFNINITSSESYKFPPLTLLTKAKKQGRDPREEENTLRVNAAKLEETLHSFNIDAQVVNVTQGPAVTRYEIHPNSGVKVKGIKNLADDIALNMEAKSIRIEAPIPGKPAVGIEIENDRINMVMIREIIESAAFKKSESKITFAVGKDIAGKAIVADLKSMPHLLIAGSTGSGKSVCINSIIASILYKARPDEVKLVLIDPKVVELANYNGIPHLLIPVVTEPAKAAAALNWAVAEMDDRYRKFAEEGARELASYNSAMRSKGEEESVMPQVVIIIDELADLMMAAPSQVEESICRLAQKARAAGMHLIVATQRPSVDVITGVV